MKQNKITKSARNEACTLKLDRCLGKGETTVFAHKNTDGVGIKATDELGRDIGFYSCFNCHTSYDQGHEYYSKEFMDEVVEFAIRATDKKLKEKGLK